MQPQNSRASDAQGIDRQHAVALAAQIKVLAHPIRLQILGLIIAAAPGHLSARQIQPHVSTTAATITHHLSRLHQAGLISRTWQANRALYAATPAACDLWPHLHAFAAPTRRSEDSH